jgi:hypothetical protein
MAVVAQPHPEMTKVAGDGTQLYGITGLYENSTDDGLVNTVFHGVLIVNQTGELRGSITDFWGEARLTGTFDAKNGLARFLKKYITWKGAEKPPDWHYELRGRLDNDQYEGVYRHPASSKGGMSVRCMILPLFPARDKVTVLW